MVIYGFAILHYCARCGRSADKTCTIIYLIPPKDQMIEIGNTYIDYWFGAIFAMLIFLRNVAKGLVLCKVPYVRVSR